MAKRPTIDDQQAAWHVQREARTQMLLQQLEAGVQTIQTDDEFQRYLQVGTQCHTRGRRRRRK